MYFRYTGGGDCYLGRGGGQRNIIRCSSGIQIVGTLF